MIWEYGTGKVQTAVLATPHQSSSGGGGGGDFLQITGLFGIFKVELKELAIPRRLRFDVRGFGRTDSRLSSESVDVSGLRDKTFMGE